MATCCRNAACLEVDVRKIEVQMWTRLFLSLFISSMNSSCSFRSDGRCCYTRDSREKWRGLCQEKWIPIFVQEGEDITFCWKDYCPSCYRMWQQRCIGNGIVFHHPVMGPLYYFAKGTNAQTIQKLKKHFPHSRLYGNHRLTRFHKSVLL
jgi:hypothetical protein